MVLIGRRQARGRSRSGPRSQSSAHQGPVALLEPVEVQPLEPLHGGQRADADVHRAVARREDPAVARAPARPARPAASGRPRGTARHGGATRHRCGSPARTARRGRGRRPASGRPVPGAPAATTTRSADHRRSPTVDPGHAVAVHGRDRVVLPQRPPPPRASASSIRRASRRRRGQTAPCAGKGAMPGHSSWRTVELATMRRPSIRCEPSRSTPSSSSAFTALGVSPSPQTLSRPGPAFSNSVTRHRPARRGSLPPRPRGRRRSPGCHAARGWSRPQSDPSRPRNVNAWR